MLFLGVLCPGANKMICSHSDLDKKNMNTPIEDEINEFECVFRILETLLIYEIREGAKNFVHVAQGRKIWTCREGCKHLLLLLFFNP